MRTTGKLRKGAESEIYCSIELSQIENFRSGFR